MTESELEIISYAIVESALKSGKSWDEWDEMTRKMGLTQAKAALEAIEQIERNRLFTFNLVSQIASKASPFSKHISMSVRQVS